MARYRLVLGGIVQPRVVEADVAPPLSPTKGYWAREIDDPPAFDPAFQTRSGPTWTATAPDGETEGAVEAVYVIADQLLADVKAARLSALAAYRYARETAGITVGGAVILTDRQSQAMIVGAHSLVTAAPATLIDWKGAGGWVQLDAATVTAIALAVGAHVQACFSAERTHAEAIGACETAEDAGTYDFTGGWPE